MTDRSKHASAWRIWLRRGLVGILLLLVSLTLLVGLGLRTPQARDLIHSQANRALGSLFRGQVIVDRVEEVGWTGASGVEARVLDPQGREVIRASGLAGQLSVLGLAWELIAGSPRQRISLTSVSISEATVTLYEDAEAGVSLASTFDPAVPADSPDDSPGTVDVYLSDIQLHRVHVRGAVAEQIIDGDVHALRASLDYAGGALRLEIAGADIVARRLAATMDAVGHLKGELELPAAEQEPLRVAATLQGLLAGSPVDAEFNLLGDQLNGSLNAWEIAPQTFNERVSGLRVQTPTNLYVELDGSTSALHVELECENAALGVRAQGDVALQPSLVATIEATFAGLDLAGVASAPRTNLDGVLQLRALRNDDGRVVLLHELHALPSFALGQPTPGLVSDGYVEFDEATTRLGGDLRVAETGALLAGSYWATFAEQGSSEAGAVVDLRLVDPPRLRSIAGVEARGSVQFAGLWKSDDSLLADVKVGLESVRYRREVVTDVHLDAHVSGTAANPRVKAALDFRAAGGRVAAQLAADQAAQVLDVRATQLRAGELSALAGLPKRAERGTFDVTLAARRTGESLTGALDISARHLDVAGLRDAGIDAQLSLDPNGKANVRALARLGSIGSLNVRIHDAVVPKRVDSVRIDDLRGTIETDGEVQLSQLSTLVALSDLPIERLKGRVAFSGTAARERGRRPSLQFKVYSEGLSFVGKRQARGTISKTTSAIEEAPTAVHGVDFSAAIDVPSDSPEAELDVELRNRSAILAVVQAKGETSALLRALNDPERLNSLALTGSLKVPSQPFQKLPPVIRPGALTGLVAVDAQLTGSLARPNLEVFVDAKALRTDSEAPPLDVNLNGKYQVQGGRLVATARGARARAQADVEWRGDLARIGEMNERQSPLRGEVSAQWTDLPCELIPALSERQLHGELSGDLKLQNWGEDAALEVNVHSSTLAVEKLRLKKLAVSASSSRERLVGTASIELPGGSLEAKIDSRVKWGKRSLPLLERDARAHIEARQFQLASLSPLIAREVSELAGLLNAHADLRITQQSTELTGNADVKNGVLQVPALGQRLSDIAARIVVADNRVRLEKLTAAGLTGRLEASGVAELDGFALTRAEADLHIARDEKIPVTLEGVAIGDASGDVHAVYVNHPTRPELTVDVPSFLLTTPETGGYGLQELERPSEVRVGVRRADGKFVSLPVQPLEPDTETNEDAPSGSPLSVRLRLGDVTVERGRAATAQLTGELRVKTGKPTSVNGRIEIKGGELDVQGKRFEIERGVVVFDGGDASNPTITATARWDSPTDHSVYAEYVGDVETGKIKLHSEPPLTQDEIVSLLLFGTLDGTMGTGEGNQASMAVTLAGGTVAQGLNRALSAFSNLDLSARVDTSTGSPRPELVFQVTPRVSAKVSRAVGVPNAGEAPDRTFLTLELRLQRAWALSAVFGDRGGSALDLIWRHRY